MVSDEQKLYQVLAIKVLIKKLLDRVSQLEKEVLLLSGQNTRKRKRKVYYYEDVALTDELLIEYIGGEVFTIYELEKKVSAKKNVLRDRYSCVKKQIQDLKCQNDK